ncbi:hypothetical protein [Cupriavidus sp. IK-TO18]|uniref:hypothetical protein n=1 Tax=Cupriavidus sp. IK-TO18 TaxID=2782182 RepID=UPI00189B8490|nr:hypothetical protein [Cupriavidus sp. IK-TO18]MBF6986493.1 hypothetical protein [Cupriavidus sp. IK-TO18]
MCGILSLCLAFAPMGSEAQKKKKPDKPLTMTEEQIQDAKDFLLRRGICTHEQRGSPRPSWVSGDSSKFENLTSDGTIYFAHQQYDFSDRHSNKYKNTYSVSLSKVFLDFRHRSDGSVDILLVCSRGNCVNVSPTDKEQCMDNWGCKNARDGGGDSDDIRLQGCTDAKVAEALIDLVKHFGGGKKTKYDQP